MISKLTGGLKAAILKLRHGGNIHFDDIPAMEGSARINLKKGTVTIGRAFSMKPGAYIAVVNGGTLSVADGVSMNRGSIIVCHESITIGEHCSFGPNVLIYDHDHKFGYEGLKSGFNTSPVKIGQNCWIGAGVTILRGTRIGERCVIGTGCVVKGEIPAHSRVTSGRDLIITPLKENRQYYEE